MLYMHTFENVVQDYFLCDIYKYVYKYMMKRSSGIYTLDRLEVNIRNIQPFLTKDGDIAFDVAVTTGIKLDKPSRFRRVLPYGLEQWFRLTCSCHLENGIKDFKIHNIYTYERSGIPAGWHKLTKYLVPVLSKEKMDKVAENFLLKYYPEALREPTKIVPRVMAKKLGLKVKMGRITKICSVFGKMFFAGGTTELYDDEKDEYKKIDVEPGTILVDPKVFFMRTMGSVNNTIVHECVHWNLHKNFFELAKLYNDEKTCLSCKVARDERQENGWNPVEWMEWQANRLAPRIMMPAKTTRQKIKELLTMYPKMSKQEKLEHVIEDIAKFYGVSKVSAKIRLIDLGYKEAAGVLCYVNNHYVNSYAFKPEALKKMQTFEINFADAVRAYNENLKFKRLIESGQFLYVDSHFCFNDKKYIGENKQGGAALTKYAKEHLDECCLVFCLHVKSRDEVINKNNSECALRKSLFSEKLIEADFCSQINKQDTVERKKQLIKQGKILNEIVALQQKLPATGRDTILFYMKEEKLTQEKLAEKAGMSTATLRRITNEENYELSMEKAVALCIGLQLPPFLSRDLLSKLGIFFRPGHRKDSMYCFILENAYKDSIGECNELLEGVGLPLLGKE